MKPNRLPDVTSLQASSRSTAELLKTFIRQHDRAAGEAFFDLMITDNSMPKVTGVELVNKLRAAGTKLEVVLLTGEIRSCSFRTREPNYSSLNLLEGT